MRYSVDHSNIKVLLVITFYTSRVIKIVFCTISPELKSIFTFILLETTEYKLQGLNYLYKISHFI